MHGESRFTAWTDGFEDNGGLGKTINRAGFRRVTDDGRKVFFNFPAAYRTEICAELDPNFVAPVLIKNWFQAADGNGDPYKEIRLPGIGRKRVYHLTADFIGGESVSQIRIHETVTRQESTSKLSTKYSV